MAGRLVPIMVTLYLLAGTYVLIINVERIPEMLLLIIRSAFAPQEATGAFIGGTVASALLFGMRRALFSNEAGQGSSPIAHSAAKTDEPVREGIVAGMEPFIDTLMVCTFTALVILSTGVWNRGPDTSFETAPAVVPQDVGLWSIEDTIAPPRAEGDWAAGELVFMIVTAHDNDQTGNKLHRWDGTVWIAASGEPRIAWSDMRSPERPQIPNPGVYTNYVGATLTAKAFDSVTPGLGKYLVTMAVWLFALSTMISWSYYGEQGIVYLVGERGVLPYKLAFCILILVATFGFIKTDEHLDNLTGIGTGVMLLGNLPIMWIFGRQAMRAYRNYVARLKSGEMDAGHKPPTLEDLISGRDVE